MAKVFQVDTGGTLTTSLISYWKLDDVNDFFSTNNFTNENAVAFNAGKVGNAGDTGTGNTNKALALASALGIDGGNCSISLWVKLTDAVSVGKTFANQASNGSTNTGYTLQYDGTTLAANRYKNGTSDNSATETVTLSTGTWYHIVLTYDGTTLRLYRDNVAKGTLATSGNGVSATIAAFNLFKHNVERFLSGLIDEVGVWSKALNTTEISDLYNGGSGQTMIVGATAGKYASNRTMLKVG